MTPEQNKFLKKMMHSAARGLMNRVMWAIPWKVAVALLALVLGTIVYFNMY